MKFSWLDDSLFIDRSTVRAAVDICRDTLRSNPRRAAMAAGLAGVHRVLVRLVQAGRRLDDVLYPDWREQSVDEPVFIVANPRSGTTFLHRLLCLDDQFSYLKLYHTLLPAISLFETIDTVGEVNEQTDGLLRRPVDWIEETFFSGWDHIHPLGFDRAEEDEGLFLLPLLSPGLFLLFPEIERISRAAAVDDLDEPTRQQVMTFYRESLQRLLYFEGRRGRGGRFLGKSVLLPGRIESLLETFPDARFIHLVRHPYKTIPSFVSMFRSGWTAHSPNVDPKGPETQRFVDFTIDLYRRMYDRLDRFGDEQLLTVPFEELVGEPQSTVDRIYGWLDVDQSEAAERRVTAELNRRRDYKSKHDYSLEEFGLQKEEIYERLEDVFEHYGFDPA